MATFEENIELIRSTALFGKDVRKAIADGLTQADSQSASRIATLDNRVTTVKNQVESEEVFVNLTALGDDAWRMDISL